MTNNEAMLFATAISMKLKKIETLQEETHDLLLKMFDNISQTIENEFKEESDDEIELQTIEYEFANKKFMSDKVAKKLYERKLELEKELGL